MKKVTSVIKLYNAGIPLHDIARLKHLHIHTVIDIVYQLNIRRNKDALHSTRNK